MMHAHMVSGIGFVVSTNPLMSIGSRMELDASHVKNPSTSLDVGPYTISNSDERLLRFDRLFPCLA